MLITFVSKLYHLGNRDGVAKEKPYESPDLILEHDQKVRTDVDHVIRLYRELQEKVHVAR